MAREEELEVRIPQALADEYYALFDAEVPVDLSAKNLIRVGLRSLIGLSDSEIVWTRTPIEELVWRNAELARLRERLEKQTAERDEQEGVLEQCLNDKSEVERALEAIEERMTGLQRRVGVDLKRPLRTPSEGLQ